MYKVNYNVMEEVAVTVTNTASAEVNGNSFSSPPVPYDPTPNSTLVLTKSLTTQPPIYAGQDITYTIKIRNDGPSTANTVHFSDLLPKGVTTTLEQVSLTVAGTAVTPITGLAVTTDQTTGRKKVELTISQIKKGESEAAVVTIVCQTDPDINNY